MLKFPGSRTAFWLTLTPGLEVFGGCYVWSASHESWSFFQMSHVHSFSNWAPSCL